MNDSKSSVRVMIVCEEYTIRSGASPEHTRAVAQYVDQAIRRVMNSGTIVESRKAAILATLQITDELFKAQEAREQLAQRMRALAEDARRWLPPARR